LIPEVLPAVAVGRVRPVVDRVFAFGDALKVTEYLRSYQAIGKVVLEMPWESLEKCRRLVGAVRPRVVTKAAGVRPVPTDRRAWPRPSR
jgi:hypothetical protein